MSDEAAVGVIGVGLLGSAVGRRWLAAGRGVVAFDLDTSRVDALVLLGAAHAASGQEVFERCERVALALPHSAISRQVLEQVSAAKPRTVVMDMTTGDPEEMSAIARECAARDIAYLDTTVAGSSAQVAAGEAIVMAGGDAAALEACLDLLQLFAKQVFFLGASGNGARMKLVLNLVLGLNRAVLAEGLAFAEACGFDAAAALDILRAGPAYSAHGFERRQDDSRRL